MSSRWFPLIVVLIVVFIGHFFTRFTLFRYKQKYIVTDEFRDKFVDLVNYYTEHYRVNQEMYAECIQQVNMIQEELGEDGIIAMFSDPLKKIQGQNFQLLVNVMPDMKLFERHLDSSIIRERMQHLFELCDDALLKHLGFLQRQIENEKGRCGILSSVLEKELAGLLAFLSIYCIGAALSVRHEKMPYTRAVVLLL